MGVPKAVDAVVVGAGFAGLYMLKRLRDAGLSVVVMERGAGVGGTWYWNRYPGARCDVESPHYSYSFDEELEQDWDWSERYPAQPELLRYLNHVADRFELRPDIRLETNVESAAFDESVGVWTVRSTGPDGPQVTRAKYCVMATGCLSNSSIPAFDGLEDFTGAVYHTGDWPAESVDLTGKRVAVIGTGSSGIQAIPEVAKQAEQLFVLQRTANYSVPALNGPLDQQMWQDIKDNYREVRQLARQTPTGLPYPPSSELATESGEQHRRQVFEDHWTLGGFRIGACFADIPVSQAANDALASFIHSKIDQIVDDPDVAEALKPDDHPVGSKRICVDTDYYATFNKEHVELVNVRDEPIQAITPRGLRTASREIEVDVIVFATGFDAMTGALLQMDIRGRGGEELRTHWEAGPKTYLGLSVTGFPNMFIVAGPGSPSVLANVVTAIEQHVEWIGSHIEYLQKNQLVSEARQEFEDEWVDHVNEAAHSTLLVNANSWYLGANIPGKPRVFMPYVGGVANYGARIEEVAAQNYRGFQLT